jgi:hypothetical protein
VGEFVPGFIDKLNKEINAGLANPRMKVRLSAGPCAFITAGQIQPCGNYGHARSDKSRHLLFETVVDGFRGLLLRVRCALFGGRGGGSPRHRTFRWLFA